MSNYREDSTCERRAKNRKTKLHALSDSRDYKKKKPQCITTRREPRWHSQFSLAHAVRACGNKLARSAAAVEEVCSGPEGFELASETADAGEIRYQLDWAHDRLQVVLALLYSGIRTVRELQPALRPEGRG